MNVHVDVDVGVDVDDNPAGLLGSTHPSMPDRIVDILGPALDHHGPLPVACAEHAAAIAALIARDPGTPLLIVTPTVTIRDRLAGVTQVLLDHGPQPYDFPRWPTGTESPYDDVAEGPFFVATRQGTLGTMALSDRPWAMVLDAAAAATRVSPIDTFLEGLFCIETGRDVDLSTLQDHVIAAGYRRVTTVSEMGEFAVRGGVVDLFSPLLSEPVRFELDGDTVTDLRIFDPATQRALRPLLRTWVVPAWQVPVDPASRRAFSNRLRDLVGEHHLPREHVALVEDTLESGRTPPGFAAMLPLLLDTGLITDYLQESTRVVIFDADGCRAAVQAAHESLGSEFESHRGEARIMAPPERLIAPWDEFVAAAHERSTTIELRVDQASGLLGPVGSLLRSTDLALATTSEAQVGDRVDALVRVLHAADSESQTVLLLCPSDTERARVSDILAAEGLHPVSCRADKSLEVLDPKPGLRLGIGRIRGPFDIQTFGILLIPSEAVFGVKHLVSGRRGEHRGARRLEEFRELAAGDRVVHRDHGIGRFEGLKEVTIDGRVTECLVLSYLGGDRLYVPVDHADRLEKHIAAEDGGGSLDRLGGQAWKRRTGSARKAARNIAGVLRQIYARRMAHQAFQFSPPDEAYRAFEATFPYETTPDQERAIEEVLEDLTRENPMDRLVCGDVGFGKTEVALRAAYKAVCDNKQVALLVPTTLLAEQHRLTFSARLRDTPVTVESVSRFKSPEQVRQVLERLKTAGLDILIGTHRLLSKDVIFRDLGLLIVDEEQRFGVTHKERLREIASTVHTLTLSATPIPRTLHMALAGIRELSLIATPPRDRLAVRTFVARSGVDIIRSAIQRELARNGQVFFVHNRIENLFEIAQKVQGAVPEARVAVAHGQMSGGDLEGVMSAFLRGEKNVLVCTAIVESGLDIASANTILIHDADMLGLAQLYQLRGRVGRAAEQAYCYLLVRDPSALSDDARRRIEAIERFSELASGFNLATMDLEIRGAGDVLGAEQSGHMAAIGYDFFMEMLRDAVAEVEGEEPAPHCEPEIKFDIEARIPTEFMPDERLRLRHYKRLSASRDLAEVDAIEAELLDAYRALPEAVARLVALIRIKVLARDLGLFQVVLQRFALQCTVMPDRTSIVPRLLDAAERLGARPGVVEAPNRVRITVAAPDSAQRLPWIEQLLRSVTVDDN